MKRPLVLAMRGRQCKHRASRPQPENGSLCACRAKGPRARTDCRQTLRSCRGAARALHCCARAAGRGRENHRFVAKTCAWRFGPALAMRQGEQGAVMNPRKFPYGLALACLLMIAAGVPTLAHRLSAAPVGADAAVSPWGLWVAAHTFFLAMSAGAFPIATLPFVFGYRRFRPLVNLALFISLVALLTALLFVTADLAHPERLSHALLQPNPSSVILWVIVSYIAFGLLLSVMLAYSLRPYWAERARQRYSLAARVLSLGYQPGPAQEKREHAVLALLSAVGLLLCIALAGSMGSLLSVQSGRLYWHPGLFPISFVASAFLSGAAAVLAAASLFGRGGSAYKATLLLLARLVGVMLIVHAAVLPSEILIVLQAGIPAHVEILRQITAGPFPWVFWVIQIGLGTILATALLLAPPRPTLAVSAAAALLALFGVFAFRLNFVIAPLTLTQSAFPGAEGFAFLAGEHYVPTAYEWNLVLFAIGMGGLLFLLGRRLLPILPDSAPVQFELAARGRRIFPFFGASARQPAK
jgi:Ni/Fe-hydrogenase subunit HybB-like protein